MNSASLKQISLHGLRLNDEDLQVLANALSNLEGAGLDSLELSYYRWEEGASDGLEHLISILLRMPTVRILTVQCGDSLPPNPVLDDLVLPLLRINYHIEHLHLPCTTSNTISVYTEMNKAGRRLLLRDRNTISKVEWIGLLERVSHNPDALFCVLKDSVEFMG